MTKRKAGVPKYKEEIIRVGYWSCNTLSHKHRTEQGALSCIQRRRGERGELERWKSSLMLLRLLRDEAELSISAIAFEANCSDTNVLKSVNTAIRKVRQVSCAHLPDVRWIREDFLDKSNKGKLDRLQQAMGERISLLEQALGDPHD
jgi:hypothetical protein